MSKVASGYWDEASKHAWNFFKGLYLVGVDREGKEGVHGEKRKASVGVAEVAVVAVAQCVQKTALVEVAQA